MAYAGLSYNKDIMNFCKFVGEFTRCGVKSSVGYGLKSYILEISPISGGICEVHCWELKPSSLNTEFPEQGDVVRAIVGYTMPYTKKLRNSEFVDLSSRVRCLLEAAFKDFEYASIRFNIDHGACGRLSSNPNVSIKYVTSSKESIVHSCSAEDREYLNTVYTMEATYCIE